jgi:hypothetical protein
MIVKWVERRGASKVPSQQVRFWPNGNGCIWLWPERWNLDVKRDLLDDER